MRAKRQSAKATAHCLLSSPDPAISGAFLTSGETGFEPATAGPRPAETTLDALRPTPDGLAQDPDGGCSPSPTHATDEEKQRQVDLSDVAWISSRDGTRAAGDLEDEAARYHLARHELTINADFRAITDMVAYWRRRYEGVPDSRTVIEAQVYEWCEQVLLEVVLAARNLQWDDDQLAALLSPTSLSAFMLPRQLLHATLQKRLAQKLGPQARDTRPRGAARSPRRPAVGPRLTRLRRCGYHSVPSSRPDAYPCPQRVQLAPGVLRASSPGYGSHGIEQGESASAGRR